MHKTDSRDFKFTMRFYYYFFNLYERDENLSIEMTELLVRAKRLIQNQN